MPASSGALSGATWGFGSLLRLLQVGNLRPIRFSSVWESWA